MGKVNNALFIIDVSPASFYFRETSIFRYFARHSQKVTQMPASADKVTQMPASVGKMAKLPLFVIKMLKILKSNLLIIFLIVALCLGIGVGAGLREVWSPKDVRTIMYFRFPGDLLLNMLKMLILPLIISSLVTGLASLDTKASGRIGLRAIVYYITTTLLAVFLGIVLVVSIQPGYIGGKVKNKNERLDEINPVDALLDLIRNCFPNNLVTACFSKKVTKQVAVKPETEDSDGNMSLVNAFLTTTEFFNHTPAGDAEVTYKPKLMDADGTNILGLVVFSIFLGIVIGRLGPRGRALFDVFYSLNEATMVLVKLVIWYSPIGIFFLIASKVVEMEDPGTILRQLGYYTLTVLIGLLIHGLIILPVIYIFIVRKNPYIFLFRMMKAIITALATSSSSATLPVTMECLEERNQVDSRITKFVAPIGATINMDGTALYEAVASIFIGQVNGMTMDIGKIITVSITATAAAIGAAGIPQAGLVTMMIVLTAVGLPTNDVMLILAVDWFLDRCRTSINVIGDSFGAGIVAHLSRKDLELMDSRCKMEEPIESPETLDETISERNTYL